MKAFWQRLSTRERSLIALTALVLLAFVAKYAVITPFLQRRDWVKRQLESQPQLLTKNLRYVGQKEALLAALEAARGETKAQEPKLLTGDTPSVSASDLQETVQALASREGTQVITTRVLNPEAGRLGDNQAPGNRGRFLHHRPELARQLQPLRAW